MFFDYVVEIMTPLQNVFSICSKFMLRFESLHKFKQFHNFAIPTKLWRYSESSRPRGILRI